MVLPARVPAQTREDTYTLPAVPHYELAAPSDKPNEENNHTNPNAENRGTEENPFFVKELPRERSKEDTEEAGEKAKLDRMLADYTGDLAFYTECLFGATLVLAILTGCLACAAFRQMQEARDAIRASVKSASAAEVSAKAARDSVDAAKQAFIADHRAWLQVDVTIGSQGANIDENGARVDIRYRIKNIGNALASSVTPHTWLVPFNRSAVQLKDLMGEEGNLPIHIQRKRCNVIRRKPFDIMGFLLFPNEVWPDVTGIGETQHGISLGKNEIQRILGETGAQGVGLFIVGCVDYTFPSDSANHHQTWFSYCLTKEIKTYKTDDSIMIAPTFFQAGDGNVPKDDLMLIHDPFGMGWNAD